MASQDALSRGEEKVQDMAAQLLVMLSAHGAGEKGVRNAWDQLQWCLAQVATYTSNPVTTPDALLGLLKGAREASSLRLGHPEAEALLRQIMASLEEETTRALDAGMAIPRLRELLLVVAKQLDMLPLRDSLPVHMVDGESNFCEENVAGMVKSSPQLSAPNAPYAVVSIVGAQSSGKSYLLNRLFGTEFPEMDAKHGRSQTTRGIMMSRCIGPSLLVLDIEGFDGREKGEDTLFEKQVALLALTISDTMLVNMNVFDIGREEAGATLLFKTIFKERIKLDAGLTKILVVLRMYDGETPVETLRDDVMKSMEKVWKSVNAESLEFHDYIEVNVVGLSDKSSQDFPKQVTALRRLLSNTALHCKRSANVPAASYSVSSGIFWDKIKKNKKLDIPSHQVALARLLCRQAVDDALNYVDSCEDYELLKDEESPRRFKEISDKLFGSIITMYDHETELYDLEERDKGRQYMIEKLKKVLIEASRELIKKMRRNTSEQFKSVYNENLKNMEETDADLNYDNQMVDSCVTTFRNLCEDMKVFDSDYIHRTCEELQKDLSSYTLYHILTIKEKLCTKEKEDIQQYLEDLLKNFEEQKEHAQQNLNEVLKKIEEITNQRQLAEEEMSRQTGNMLEEELEFRWKMIDKQQDTTTGAYGQKSLSLDVNEDKEELQGFSDVSKEDKQKKTPPHQEEIAAPGTRAKHNNATLVMASMKSSRVAGKVEGSMPHGDNTHMSEKNAPEAYGWKSMPLNVSEDKDELQAFPHVSKEDKKKKIPLHHEIVTPVNRDKHHISTPVMASTKNSMGAGKVEGSVPQHDNTLIYDKKAQGAYGQKSMLVGVNGDKKKWQPIPELSNEEMMRNTLTHKEEIAASVTGAKQNNATLGKAVRKSSRGPRKLLKAIGRLLEKRMTKAKDKDTTVAKLPGSV